MELRLIRFIRHNPFMYNPNHMWYRNQVLKDEKWTQLSQETQLPVDILKKRWKSLRDRYFKIKRLNNGKSKYKFYKYLLFLGEIERSNKSEISEDDVDDLLTKSEDSLLMDQASFTSFNLNDTEMSTPCASKSGKEEQNEDIEEVLLVDPPSSSNAQNSTPFRVFLESIALTVEKANFSMNEVMTLQMRILQLLQDEMNKRTVN